MKITNNNHRFQPPTKLPAPQKADAPSASDKFIRSVERKAGAMSSLIAGTAIGAGVTALAVGAMGVGMSLAAPAILCAGAAGVAIGMYRSRNEKGNFAAFGRMISGGLHGAGGLAGGLIGKATVLGLASGGTGMAIAAGVGATAVAGVALAYGTVKFVEMFRWRG